jgi:2-oxoglutarate dehydrogenase complex dehydrogenase (E1) component-like enzyme
MAWASYTYGEFLNNFERISRIYQEEYTKNIQRIIDVYSELYKQFIKNNEQMSELYKQYFDNIQRINQQWLNLFRNPFAERQEEKKEKENKRK